MRSVPANARVCSVTSMTAMHAAACSKSCASSMRCCSSRARSKLPENFTFATMADVHAMPLPCARRAPIAALLAAYIAGAWSLVGAAFLIIPQHMTAFVQHTLAVTSTVLAALGGIGHVFAHLGDRGDMSFVDHRGRRRDPSPMRSWVVAVVAALRFVRPRIVERLRW